MKRRAALALAAIVAPVLLAVPANAHGTDGYDWWPSISRKDQKRVVRRAHGVFGNHRRAHKVLRLWDCEAEFQWWERSGTYWYMMQADANYRASYGGGLGNYWTVKEQAIATKRGIQARGWAPWPNCP